MRKIIYASVFCVMLCSCATTPKTVYVYQPIAVPKAPKVVAIDKGQTDKDKYPATEWVKSPEVDLKNRRASWSFDDIDKISRNLSEWPTWGDQVYKIIDQHNKSAENKDSSPTPTRRWWFW